MRPVQKTLGSVAASTNSIATAQTTAGAAYLTLTASPVTFANAMQCSLTVAVANLSTINFTFTGTDADGHLQTETIAGPNNNTVFTTKFFLTVTSVYASAAVGTNVTAGNSALSVSGTFICDYINSVANMGYGFTTSGSGATYKLQHTYDDVFDATQTGSSAKTWFDDTTVTGKTGAFNYSMTNAVRGSRIAITAWTSGTVTGTLIQGLEK